MLFYNLICFFSHSIFHDYPKTQYLWTWSEALSPFFSIHSHYSECGTITSIFCKNIVVVLNFIILTPAQSYVGNDLNILEVLRVKIIQKLNAGLPNYFHSTIFNLTLILISKETFANCKGNLEPIIIVFFKIIILRLSQRVLSNSM